jgi:CheY-like chemotaxis protein
VDADRDRQETVRLSLALDPAFTVESCDRAKEAVARAAVRSPDLILCEVAVPGVDEPAVLAQLAEAPDTASVPIVFVAAPQPGDLDRLKSLGAAGVIARPLDPAALAGLVRRHLRFIKLADLREHFVQRLHRDARLLAQLRTDMGEAPSTAILEDLQSCAHKLAGTAGVFEFTEISNAASALEESVIARGGRAAGGDTVENDLDDLIRCIEDECSIEWTYPAGHATSDRRLRVDRGGTPT